jgi:P-type Mg2+ transporter
VLLKRDLGVLRAGIEEGRRTFANTLKYVFTTTSANFGNMFSLAGASLFLPFLPLLAKQILLNNFLSDFPALAIASDRVDEDMVERPHRWNIRFIRDFMIVFGLVSSVFDYLTFGMLLFVVRASPEQFRTGWFIESLLTELVIALVVRTRGLSFRSRPGTLLWTATLVVGLVTLAIPYLPFGGFLGFTPLPAWLMLALLGITALYVAAAELAKRFFYARAAW